MMSVSVVITTHNRPQLLLEAIKSVLQQSFPVKEIIVVDDASEISSASMIHQLNSTIIHYHKFPQSQGANAARNYGIENSSGDFIAFLDDDDQWDSRKVEHQINHTLSYDSVFSYTGMKLINTQGKVVQETFHQASNENEILVSLFKKNFIGGTSSILVNRKFLMEYNIRFDPFLPALQDYDFYIQIFHHTQIISAIELPLVHYRHEPNWSNDKTSANYLKFKTAQKYLIEKYSDSEFIVEFKQSLQKIFLKKLLRYPRFLKGFVISKLTTLKLWG